MVGGEGKLDRKNVLFVGGIGCTARTSMYTMFDSAHVTHGRAIPFATGAKLANPPNIIPVVFSGDGDLAGIGGNHLIHAARRNMDLLVVVINNMTYGLTGGPVIPPHNPPRATTPPPLHTGTRRDPSTDTPSWPRRAATTWLGHP